MNKPAPQALFAHVESFFSGYLKAVEDAFGTKIDFAQLVKIYGKSYNNTPEARYSPAQ